MKVNNSHISHWKAILLEDSLKEALSFPALKVPLKNEWAEEDGAEYDLSAPKLNPQEITLKFLVSEAHYVDFVNVFKRNAYNNFLFESLGKTYRLRLINILKTQYVNGNFFLDLKFSNDNPFHGYTYSVPNLKAIDTNALLDGRKLSKYGVILLEGCKQEILAKGEIKKPLEIQNSLLNGAIVAEKQQFFKEKTAKLHCCIIQDSLSNLLSGYEAFFYDLIRPNERIFTYENIHRKCIYKDSRVTYLSFEKKSYWIDFELQLTFIA